MEQLPLEIRIAVIIKLLPYRFTLQEGKKIEAFVGSSLRAVPQ